MLGVFNRDYKQEQEALIEEFPNSRILIKLDSDNDTCGYLIAVSKDRSTEIELDTLADNMHDAKYRRVYGAYSSLDQLYNCTYVECDFPMFGVLQYDDEEEEVQLPIRDYKQSFEELHKEFPNDVLFVQIDDANDTEGYLLWTGARQSDVELLEPKVELSVEFQEGGGYLATVNYWENTTSDDDFF